MTQHFARVLKMPAWAGGASVSRGSTLANQIRTNSYKCFENQNHQSRRIVVLQLDGKPAKNGKSEYGVDVDA